MASKVEGIEATLLWTLNEDQIAQPGIVDRIHKAAIYNNGIVRFFTSKGTTVSSISLPVNKSDTELQDYFSQVFWVAYQALGQDSYRLSPSVRGDGAGGAVSTGKPGTTPLSGDILKVYKDYKKHDPTWTLDKMLLAVVECLVKTAMPRITISGTGEKIGFDITWIEGLLKAGVDPNITDGKHRSLIELLCYYAVIERKAENKHFGTVVTAATALIRAGANVRVQPEGRPLIEPACLTVESWPIYKGLLPIAIKNGSVIRYNEPDSEGRTLLDKVISKAGQKGEFLKCAQELVEAGLDVNQGHPVHELVSLKYCWQFSDLLDLLLSKKPPLEASDSQGKFILERAVSHPEAFKKIVRAGARLEDPKVNMAVFKAAIAAGTDGEIHPYLQGKVAPAKGLHFAFAQQKHEFVRKIVKESGVSIDYVDAENPLTCLQVLFKDNRWNQEDEKSLQLLLELQADVKKIEEAGLIALPWRIKVNFPAAIQYAFRTNLEELRKTVSWMNVDYVDESYPETCLQTLCRENKWEGEALLMLQTLLSNRADTQKIRGAIFRAFPSHIKKLMPELFDLKEIAPPLIQKILPRLKEEFYRSLEQTGKMQALGNLLVQELEKLSDIQRLLMDESDEGFLRKKKLVDSLVAALNSILSKSSDLEVIKGVISDTLNEWQAQINLQIEEKIAERIRQQQANQQREDLQRLAANEKEMQAKIAEMQRQLAVSEESIRAYSRQAAQTEAERKNLEETVAKQKQALSGAVYLSSQTQREMLYYGIRLN